MMLLTEHPVVKRVQEKIKSTGDQARDAHIILDAAWLRSVCLKHGADDAGFVEVDCADLSEQKAEILAAFPRTRSLVSFVRRMNRDNVRSPARSVANLEFHHTGDEVNDIARRVVAELERRGVRALNPAMGFPMEMDRFPDRSVRVVSHKTVAVAAGLGRMGIHRNVIHPVFGNFILLGTILIDAEISEYSRPIDYNPCVECKLCVAACPVGAIGTDGYFDFSACYTHNYREFMGGFTDWVENIADSKNAIEYRKKMTDPESASMWQSLSFGANYKSAYCMAVCPAGEDVIGPFLTQRKEFLQEVVKPLQDKEETVYVIARSDAEEHVARRFAHKKIKNVKRSLRPRTIEGFLRGLRITFQRRRSEGIHAVFHFTFTGEESHKATVIIRDKKIDVSADHIETADLHVVADSETWIAFLRKERSLVWAILRRKIRIHGSPRQLLAFSRCFPT
jgi:ferredoxin